MKAPHKFSQTILQRGLRPMNVKEAVVDNVSRSNDPEEQFGQRAEELVAAGLAQAYTDMLQIGLQYGCLETGESTIFLRIDEDDPNTLFYHLAISQLKVQQYQDKYTTNTDTKFPSPLTALGQMLSFVLMALKPPQRSPDLRTQAIDRAQKWGVDEEAILHQIPVEQAKPGIESPAYKSKALRVVRSPPYFMRDRKEATKDGKKEEKKEGCNDKWEARVKDEEDGNDKENDKHLFGRNMQMTTPTPAQGRGKNRQNRNTRTGGGEASKNNQAHQYCTQFCLLGLVKGTTLDRSCPNLRAHRRGTKTAKHLITQSRLRTLIQKQLAKSLSFGLIDLYIQGSRGCLLKVTLLSHGYTFVVKGTRDVFVPDLHHEATIYKHLHPLQGDMIPVHLGNIDLEKKWWDLGYCIIHGLLLAYADEPVDLIRDHEAEHRFIVEKIQAMEISHGDLAERNTLRDPRTGKLMVVDFERARCWGIVMGLIGRKRRRCLARVRVIWDLRGRGGGRGSCL